MRWGVIGLLVLIAVAATALIFGASFMVRQVLAAYLDDIGASYEGLETVRFDFLRGSVSAGPLTVGGETPATLRKGEVSLSLRGLLRGRALITSLRIEGLEVEGRRDVMGSVHLAGLPLADLVKEADDGRTAEVGEGQWLMGAMNASVVDSRLLFTDLNGGEIELEIARFEMDRLLEWEPDTSTAFTLDATFNGMPLLYDGTIAPLAQPVTVDLSGDIEQITYNALARFAGERPTVEIAGALAARGKHHVSLFADGRLEGASSGEVVLQDFELTTPDGETVTSERAQVTLDLDHDIGLDKQAVLAGDVKLDVSPSRLVSALGEQVALSGTSVEATGFTAREVSGPDSAGLLEGLVARLDFVASDDGRRLSLSDLIVRAVAEVAEEILSASLEISGSPSISIQGLSLVAPDEAGVEVFRSDVGRIFAASQALRAEHIDAEWRLDADLTAGAEGYASQAVVAGETVRSRVANLSIASDALSARTSAADTRLAFDLDLALSGSVNEAGGGARLALTELRAGSTGIQVVGQSDLTGETRGPLTLEAEGVDGSVLLEGRAIDLAGQSLRIDLGRLVLQRWDKAGATLAGRIRLTDWTVDETATPLEAGFAVLDITLPTTEVTVDGDGVTVRPATAPAVSNERVPDPEGADATAPPPGGRVGAGDRLSVPRIMPSPPRPPRQGRPSDAETLEVAPLVVPRAVPVPVMRPTVSLEESTPSREDEPTAVQSVEGAAAARASADGGVFGVALAGFVGKLPSDEGVLSMDGEGADLKLNTFDLRLASSTATLDGRVDFSGWRVNEPDSGIAGDIGSAQLEAHALRVDFGGDRPRLSGGFEAQIAALSVETPAIADRHWRLGANTISAEVAEAGLSGEESSGRGRVEIAGANLEEIGSAGANAFGAGEVAIDGLSIGRDRLQVGVVSVDGLDMAITGHLLESLFFSEDGSDSRLQAGVEHGASPPNVRIESIDVGDQSRILWSDEIANRRLRLQITMDPVQIGPVDLADPSQQTKFDLRMTTERGAKVSLSGSARLAADPPDFDLSARLDDIQLAHASPYAEAVGFALESGLLSSTLNARASGGSLEGALEVVLTDFRFSPAYPGAEEAFAKEFVVSPSYAVNILRDESGRIDLKFPISGTLGDPDIDLSALMTKATGGVLVSLLPFNWFSGDKWALPQLVVQFAPGSVDLVAGFEPLLAEVAQILVNDTRTPVTLCGVATLVDVPDRPGLTTGGPTPDEITAALRLALSREMAVRAYLETEGSVPTDRLIRCDASFQDAPAVPGVLFSATRQN